MPEIRDVPHALELLEQAVSTRGADYVYRQHVAFDEFGAVDCRYEHDDQPDCVIGVVLHLAGYDIVTLGRLDSYAHGKPLSARYLYRHLYELGAEACYVLGVAQEAQDNGYSWGEALSAARAAAANTPSYLRSAKS